MIQHPSVEGRDIFTDGRFPGYQAALEAERADWLASMLRVPRAGLDPTAHHVHMARCAGAIVALDFALGKPGEMKDSDPAESTT